MDRLLPKPMPDQSTRWEVAPATVPPYLAFPSFESWARISVTDEALGSDVVLV